MGISCGIGSLPEIEGSPRCSCVQPQQQEKPLCSPSPHAHPRSQAPVPTSRALPYGIQMLWDSGFARRAESQRKALPHPSAALCSERFVLPLLSRPLEASSIGAWPRHKTIHAAVNLPCVPAALLSRRLASVLCPFLCGWQLSGRSEQKNRAEQEKRWCPRKGAASPVLECAAVLLALRVPPWPHESTWILGSSQMFPAPLDPAGLIPCPALLWGLSTVPTDLQTRELEGCLGEVWMYPCPTYVPSTSHPCPTDLLPPPHSLHRGKAHCFDPIMHTWKLWGHQRFGVRQCVPVPTHPALLHGEPHIPPSHRWDSGRIQVAALTHLQEGPHCPSPVSDPSFSPLFFLFQRKPNSETKAKSGRRSRGQSRTRAPNAATPPCCPGFPAAENCTIFSPTAPLSPTSPFLLRRFMAFKTFPFQKI